jgi:hypothetical protein
MGSMDARSQAVDLLNCRTRACIPKLFRISFRVRDFGLRTSFSPRDKGGTSRSIQYEHSAPIT